MATLDGRTNANVGQGSIPKVPTLLMDVVNSWFEGVLLFHKLLNFHKINGKQYLSNINMIKAG